MSAKSLPPVFCLLGPTASGKTDLAVQLTTRFPLEIISVDSALVYKRMDIGTAKPTKEELEKTPHHLIDIRDPAETYSAGEFCEDAKNKIKEIQAADRFPLLVGGTMLYFNLLQRGFIDFPSTDPIIREKITKEAEEKGWGALHQKLSEIDPISAKKIHPNDPQRIQRALELFEMTGRTKTELQANQLWEEAKFSFINLTLLPKERQFLHDRIKLRVDHMLSRGLVKEVEAFYNRGDLTERTPSMRLINYRQVWQYLSGQFSKEELSDRLLFATRQLAKRQLTWLRGFEATRSFYIEDKLDPVFKEVEQIILASKEKY